MIIRIKPLKYMSLAFAIGYLISRAVDAQESTSVILLFGAASAAAMYLAVTKKA